MSRLFAMKWLCVSFFLVALVACGGGGSSSGNGQFTVNGSGNISFSADLADSTPAPQTVSGSVTGVNSTVYLFVVTPGTAISNVTFSMTGQTTGAITIFPKSPSSLGPGTHTDTVTVRVCLDAGCSSQVSGSPKTINVTYTVTDTFDARPASLSFSSVFGGSAPSSRSISISGSQSHWTAVSNQSWLAVNQASGIGAATIQASIDPAGLDVGTYHATITVADSTSGTSVDIPVSYDISLPVIGISSSSLSFSGINGANIATRTVSFSLNNGQDAMWTATPRDSWLVLSGNSWSASSNVTASIDAATGSLASGNYTSAIDFVAEYAGHTLTHSVPVTLSLSPATLYLTSPGLNFIGGRSPDFKAQEVNISLSSGMLTSHPWTATLNNDQLPAWLVADATSGSVASSNVSVSLSINSAGLVLSSYTGEISVSATVNGDTLTQTLPVSLRLEPHRLLVPDNGIALVSLPGVSKLSQTVSVLDNRDITTNWAASSDQAWLSVTPSGTTDGSLTVTADTTALATDTIHYATVTLTSPDSSVVNSGEEAIEVGLYVGSAAAAAQSSVTFTNPSKNTGLVADPIRPYVYVTHGGTNVEIYNVYTGAPVNTMTNVGADLREMTVSTDGKTLYVVDHVNLGIYPVDLATQTPGIIISPAHWSNCTCSANPYLVVDVNYARNNGRELLLTTGPNVLDAQTGEVLYGAPVSIFTQSVVSEISGDGRSFYSAGTSSAPHSVKRYELRYSALDDVMSVEAAGSSSSKSAYARGFAANYDGSRLYRACWYDDNSIEQYDGIDLSTISSVVSGTNGGVFLADNDRLFCARYYSAASPDVWEVDLSSGNIVNEYTVAGEVNERQIVVSADSMRLVTRSNSRQTLTFTSTVP